MRYMGDYPMAPQNTEVHCVYTILVNCHKNLALRDEVYCQIMKQTTNNKSSIPDSCQRGWRLFCIAAAYFTCSDNLKPYLFKYLETAAYDKRRAYHGTAVVCLQNRRNLSNIVAGKMFQVLKKLQPSQLDGIQNVRYVVFLVEQGESSIQRALL